MVKLLRYLEGTKDLATFMPCAGAVDKIVVKSDSDRACDDFDPRSIGGAVIYVGDCRIHTHSRSLSPHALSSGEAGIMEVTEALKEALQMQYS